MRRTQTRENIKRAARRLFAKHGFANVSVRDIVSAAGQKNGASVNYYFHSKEKLLEEILVDGAKMWDIDRNIRIDTLETAGKPIVLRDVIYAAFNPGDNLEGALTYYRLFRSVMTEDRDIYNRVVEHAFDSGYRRAVAHIRTLLPNIPWPLLAERLKLTILHATTVLATRPSPSSEDKYWARFWATPTAKETLFDTIEGMLSHPPSPKALADLAARDAAASLDGRAETTLEPGISSE